MEELIRNLKNDVGGGTSNPVSKASYTTSASVQDKKAKEGRGRETGDYAMNIYGHSFPFSELQGLKGSAVDLKPFPTPFELGMNQSLHSIYGNIRHGSTKEIKLLAIQGFHPSLLCPRGLHCFSPSDFGLQPVQSTQLVDRARCCAVFERQEALAAALDARPELLVAHTYLLCDNERDLAAVTAWLNPFQTLVFQQSFMFGLHLLPWNVLSGRPLLIAPRNIERDPVSGLEVPTRFSEWTGREVVPCERSLSDSYLSFFVISDSTQRDGWQWRLFKSLLSNGHWGCVGQRHNLLIPLLLTDEASAPEVGGGPNAIRFAAIITGQGMNLGDIALKLLAPLHLLAIDMASVQQKLESIAMKRRDIMVAKAVLNSFETMRYGQFVGGLPGGSSHFIRAVRSLLYLLSQSLRQEGHRVANLLIRHSGLNPYRMRVEDDDWIAFDTLVVVFQMMQYFMQFTLISNTNPFSGMRGFFLERTAEPWGRYQVSRQFCRFVGALLEVFVVPEEFDEYGNICTETTTVYKYQTKLGYYTVVGVEASYKEFEDAISNDAAKKDAADDSVTNQNVRCAAAEKLATAQVLMMLITTTLPAVCLQEPPEEVLPMLISLLRLAFGRVLYVMETSQLPERQSLEREQAPGGTHATGTQVPKDLQPVLSLACKDPGASMNCITMPIFIVPAFIAHYIRNWRAAISDSYRCVLPLLCELLFEMLAPLALCHQETSLLDAKGDVEPMVLDIFYKMLFKGYDLLKPHRKRLLEVWHSNQELEIFVKDIDNSDIEKIRLKNRLPVLPDDQMKLNFWRVIDSLWPTTPNINQLMEIASMLTTVGNAALSKKSGILQFLKHAERFRAQSSDTQQKALDSFYSGYGLNDHVLSALHMQVPLTLLTPDGLERRFKQLQKYAWETHPFYIEDRDNQPTLRPPHCYATSKEEEEIGRLLRDADSITRTARELSTAQALREEEKELSRMSKMLSALDLPLNQARLPATFDESNLRAVVPHVGQQVDTGTYSSHLSSDNPLFEINDSAIRTAVLESLGVPEDQVLGVYEIPLDPAILNQEHAGPGGEGRAIRLDIPVAALGGAAARAELAFGPTVAMPMPGGSGGADSSYRARDATWGFSGGQGTVMDSSLPIVDAPLDSRPIPTDAEFAADMIRSLVQNLPAVRPSASRIEKETLPTNEHHST